MCGILGKRWCNSLCSHSGPSQVLSLLAWGFNSSLYLTEFTWGYMGDFKCVEIITNSIDCRKVKQIIDQQFCAFVVFFFF